ncbi:RNA 2'-phosphotransferase [Allosphingosinicella sp.]|jgi:putative RNA 2'-phosphotransferase|uniref:RNA 2'-phosphotransferase n=1 Tax=Allosphingosinicella sp. TaxID=2823234 RepID=UPI002EF15F00
MPGQEDGTDPVRVSKFLSFVLRHRPGRIGITLDAEGWADLDQLIERANAGGMNLTRAAVEEAVRTSDKQRFALSCDGRSIRAQQGHSTSEVSLTFEPREPPPLLFHGTADRNISSIREHGLKPGKRHHVHLSADRRTALAVGARHGRAVVLLIDSGRMHRNDHPFYRSGNGVWLTDRVAPDCILEWDLAGPGGKPEETDRLALLSPGRFPTPRDRLSSRRSCVGKSLPVISCTVGPSPPG